MIYFPDTLLLVASCLLNLAQLYFLRCKIFLIKNVAKQCPNSVNPKSLNLEISWPATQIFDKNAESYHLLFEKAQLVELLSEENLHVIILEKIQL